MIKTREEVKEIIDKIRKDKKIGYTSGSFDLVHAGHLDYLRKAKEKCDILIVGVNSDLSIKEYKSKDRPIIGQNYRSKLIAGLKPVDYVFIFEEKNNNVNIEYLKPDFYIKAGDWDKSKLSSAPIVESYGGEVISIAVVEETSTTDIIKKIVEIENNKELKGHTLEIKRSGEKQKAVFFDRDGTINVDHSYVSEPEKFELIKGAVEGMKAIQDKGYKIIVITTQTGIGMGYYTKEDFYKVNLEMFKQVSNSGIRIDKIYFCPHSLSEDCECRKPKVGLVKRAEEDLNLDLSQCYIIGDKATDIMTGKNSGMKTILVSTGSGEKDKGKANEDHFVKDLIEASELIN